MRRIAAFVLITACLGGASGCTTARADGSPKMQTTSEANRENVQGAAEAPLRDLNVLRTKVPDVLLEAMADPYARPPPAPRRGKTAQCDELAELVQALDEALGPDLDNPAKEDESLIYRGKDVALGAMAGAAQEVIPFRGWVRKLSGAERHDRFVENAIVAGAVRRAYLKGLGEARGCEPPATPSHLLTGQVEEAKAAPDRHKPRYPIR
jgi:hypothetical protein